VFKKKQLQKQQLFADYTTIMTLDDKDFELSLWDTNSSNEYEHIRPLNFAKTDVFLLCFAMNNATSLNNTFDKWDKEIKRHFQPDNEPLKLLVGLKADLREDEEDSFDNDKDQQLKVTRKQQEMVGAAYTANSGPNSVGTNPLSTNTTSTQQSISTAMTTTKEQIAAIAEKIGAVDYVECSALVGDSSVTDVFLTAIRCVVYPQDLPLTSSNPSSQASNGAGGKSANSGSEEDTNTLDVKTFSNSNKHRKIKKRLPSSAPNGCGGRKNRCILC